jgi:hypothetical protein
MDIKNTIMLMITLSTIHQTIFLITLIYLSKGWLLTTEGSSGFGNIDQDGTEASRLSAIIGAIYVSYCAYYLANDNFVIQVFISVFLNSLYVILVYILLKNSLYSRK